MDVSQQTPRQDCPGWCAVRHEASPEDILVHIGGALLVKRTVLRLCTTIDSVASTEDGPYVLVGHAEFTLHEAEALLAAVTQLVDQARASLLAQQSDSALPVLDP
jgi:hypothetical protein